MENLREDEKEIYTHIEGLLTIKITDRRIYKEYSYSTGEKNKSDVDTSEIININEVSYTYLKIDRPEHHYALLVFSIFLFIIGFALVSSDTLPIAVLLMGIGIILLLVSLITVSKKTTPSCTLFINFKHKDAYRLFIAGSYDKIQELQKAQKEIMLILDK